jgi:DNA-binding Lrp family transcriptional regulator
MEHELFKVMVDLIVYKALQDDGTLSLDGIAHRTGIHPTTVQYAIDRLRKRDFYDVRAVPRLERFQHDVPMAVIGFSDAHPIAIDQLERNYRDKPEVLFMIRGEKEIVLFMMDLSREKLAKKLYSIMGMMSQKPSIYITSPQIAKMGVSIPDKIIDKVYNNLPDRRAQA